MTATAQKVLNEAKQLSPIDRAELLEGLFESFDPPHDPEIERAWQIEIERRMKEIENGTARLIPADEVFREIEKGMGK